MSVSQLQEVLQGMAPVAVPDGHVCSQIAMLFLSRGELFHEATWALWFRSAAGLLPAASLRNDTCSKDGAFALLPRNLQASESSALRYAVFASLSKYLGGSMPW